jgi:hypothetical protein
MSDDADPLTLLERALAQTAAVIAAIPAAQAGLATPCPALAEHALAWSRRMLRPEYRGSAFGPEVLVKQDAPAYQRLAGWFGRDPRWAPALSRSEVRRR